MGSLRSSLPEGGEELQPWLGIRRPATGADRAQPKERRSRWRATGFPRHWTCEDVELCLAASTFERVEMHEKVPWRRAAAWVFMATAPSSLDFQVIQISVPGSTESLEVECSQLSRRLGKQEGRALSFEWKQVHLQGSQRQRRRQSDAERPSCCRCGGRRPNHAAEDMDVEAGEARRLDDGKSAPKQDDGAPAKKAKSQAWNLPVGMSLQDNSGGGDCLFYTFADCLIAQGRSARAAAELRNLCVTHIRRHIRSYEGYWRGDSPDSSGSSIREGSFEGAINRDRGSRQHSFAASFRVPAGRRELPCVPGHCQAACGLRLGITSPHRKASAG